MRFVFGACASIRSFLVLRYVLAQPYAISPKVISSMVERQAGFQYFRKSHFTWLRTSVGLHPMELTKSATSAVSILALRIFPGWEQ